MGVPYSGSDFVGVGVEVVDCGVANNGIPHLTTLCTLLKPEGGREGGREGGGGADGVM